MSEQTRSARRSWRQLGRELGSYAVAAAISSLAAIPLLGLRAASLRVPFDYRGDAWLYSSVIKSVVEHGWFWTNPSVGAPGIYHAYDYPNVAHESMHLLIIKAMSLFSHDWVLLLNLYFLIGFPVITLSAMFTFRRLGIGTGPAIVAAVLFAFLPTRLLKGEGHLFLDVFFQVPLAILVLLWVCSANPPAALRGDTGARRRAYAAIAICVLSGCTSSYFSFFVILLLVAGGAWASYEHRSARQLISGLALSGVIAGTMVANGWPSIAYHLQHGGNRDVGRREPHEAEVFGLKVAQLLLPVEGHRLPALRQLEQRYSLLTPINGETTTTSLGLVGDVGFIALLAAVVVRRRKPPGETDRAAGPRQAVLAKDDWLPSLATLNLGAVMLGTVGGFGALFALLVSPQIRAYSRLAVLIGSFALLAVALMLDRLRQRRPRVGLAVLPAVLLLGLLDQSSLAAQWPYAESRAAFDSDRDLVRTIETSLPAGSAVFALPYVSFPESPDVQQLSSNDQLRGYLHSRSLRWSFPTMRGRNGDRFAREVADQPPVQMLRTLALADFNGILIYRRGYADNGAAIEAGLRAALGGEPLLSRDGTLAFFGLTDYRLHNPVTGHPGDVVARLLHPVAATFDGDFYQEEQGPEHDPFRWCEAKGQIHPDNDLGVTRRMSLRAVLEAAKPPARLEISGDLVATTIVLDGRVPFARELDVAPGHHVLRFRCDGGRADAPWDPRDLVWRIENLTIRDSAAPAQTHASLR